MTITSPSTPHLDFDIGASVDCRDGGCGKLARVVIDPDTERVEALIVEKGMLIKESRVVPLRAVLQASEDSVKLDLDSDDLEQYPEYNEVEYAIPSEDWQHDRYRNNDALLWVPPYGGAIGNTPVFPMVRQRIQEGIPSTLEAIGRGTPVHDVADEIGTVDHVLTSRDTGLITHLVIRHGALLGRDARILPISMVTEIDDQGVAVDLQGRDYEDLPEYDPEH